MTREKRKIDFAAEGDVQGICEIEKACFSVPWSEKSIRDFIADTDRNLCIAARSDSGVLGYVGFRYVLDEGDICNIGVLPEYQGQGIARSLLLRLFEICLERGITIIHLEVRVGNLNAIALYEKVGFEENGRRKAYYADTNEDALLYVRNLTKSEQTDR